jgi:hypothetical protein
MLEEWNYYMKEGYGFMQNLVANTILKRATG